MSSSEALAILKNWQSTATVLESNAISRFKPGRSTAITVEDVTESKLVISDPKDFETLPLDGATFDGIEPTDFSPLRALQIKLGAGVSDVPGASGALVLFIEKT